MIRFDFSKIFSVHNLKYMLVKNGKKKSSKNLPNSTNACQRNQFS